MQRPWGSREHGVDRVGRSVAGRVWGRTAKQGRSRGLRGDLADRTGGGGVRNSQVSGCHHGPDTGSRRRMEGFGHAEEEVTPGEALECLWGSVVTEAPSCPLRG